MLRYGVHGAEFHDGTLRVWAREELDRGQTVPLVNSPRILFATPEFDDFVRVGGLAAVSAALPGTLRPQFDIRVVLPGYAEVLSHCAGIQIVGRCDSLAGLPPCTVGRIDTRDGLPVYVVLCPDLYERDGSPSRTLGGP